MIHAGDFREIGSQNALRLILVAFRNKGPPSATPGAENVVIEPHKTPAPVVNGNVDVGTKTPGGKLEVCDDGACVKWVKTLGNYGEDVYGSWQVIFESESNVEDQCFPVSPVDDSCDNNAATPYACEEAARKKCFDLSTQSAGCWSDASVRVV